MASSDAEGMEIASTKDNKIVVLNKPDLVVPVRSDQFSEYDEPITDSVRTVIVLNPFVHIVSKPFENQSYMIDCNLLRKDPSLRTAMDKYSEMQLVYAHAQYLGGSHVDGVAVHGFSKGGHIPQTITDALLNVNHLGSPLGQTNALCINYPETWVSTKGKCGYGLFSLSLNCADSGTFMKFLGTYSIELHAIFRQLSPEFQTPGREFIIPAKSTRDVVLEEATVVQCGIVNKPIYSAFFTYAGQNFLPNQGERKDKSYKSRRKGRSHSKGDRNDNQY